MCAHHLQKISFQCTNSSKWLHFQITARSVNKASFITSPLQLEPYLSCKYLKYIWQAINSIKAAKPSQKLTLICENIFESHKFWHLPPPVKPCK